MRMVRGYVWGDGLCLRRAFCCFFGCCLFSRGGCGGLCVFNREGEEEGEGGGTGERKGTW